MTIKRRIYHFPTTWLNISGNRNIELCFKTDNFEQVIEQIRNYSIKYLHEIIEEPWGQQTIRFYDPEHNLFEIGETLSCFVKRFYNQGMTPEEVSKKHRFQ